MTAPLRQHCHRCGLAVPVAGPPLTWCPRCAGVLSAPTDRAARVSWVAHPPPGARPPRAVPRPPPGPTPRYHDVPRWGLHDGWARRRDAAWAELDDAQRPEERLAARGQVLQVLLVTVAVAAGAGVLAEGFRYALALRGRTQLLGATTVALSDAAVITTGLLAPIFAVAAAVLAARWLLAARAVAAARAGVRETRRGWVVVAGVLLPVVNLVAPAVWLAELEARLRTRPGSRPDPAPRPSRLLLAWWTSWAASQALVLVVVGIRVLGDSVQAQASSIVAAAWSDLAAVVCAVLAVVLLRRLGAELDDGPRRTGRRWIASVPAPRETGTQPSTQPEPDTTTSEPTTSGATTSDTTASDTTSAEVRV